MEITDTTHPSVWDTYKPVEHQEPLAPATATATWSSPHAETLYDFDFEPEASATPANLKSAIDSSTSPTDQLKHHQIVLLGMEKDIASNRKQINYLHKKIRTLDDKSESLFTHPDIDSADIQKSSIFVRTSMWSSLILFDF